MFKLLFREDTTNTEEAQAAKSVFKYGLYITKRSLVKEEIISTICIGRYSVLPFYKELEDDIAPAKMINSYNQHKYIADADYIKDLGILTFKTWTDKNFYEAPEGKYVVKGATNSKKHQWNTKMFANSKREALAIAAELAQDGLISSQEILYREYVPLETYEILLNGLPVTNEWRFFFFKDQIIDYVYYWSTATNILKKENIEPGAIDLAKQAADILCKSVNFFVIDVAKTQDGRWIVVEVNDAQMSGLSCIDPTEFYTNLYNILLSSLLNSIRKISEIWIQKSADYLESHESDRKF
jgi:hypothetical protein